ncbi:hypothetical protein BDY19DRAFT_991875 [Irpex rosettiformis]|uniref:Uncharacterized protein n=1 Tax=Irpex rosettiformis TaxID=378272 RepID=A0ACB8UAG2_9APHY|nr:hypothetical protein BDY19DRAFT_991875 [Irpex rosettiformis]
MRPRIGPTLPRSIVEELQADSGQNTHRKGGRGKLSRKDARKQDREQKKQRKAEFFSSSHAYNPKRPAEDEHVDSPRRKRVKVSEVTESTKHAERKHVKRKTLDTKSSRQEHTERPQDAVKQIGGKLETPLEKLSRKTSSGRTANAPSVLPRSQQEQQEDAYIAYLESKLGWSKSGSRTSKYGKGLGEDGLDDLLADIDTIETSIFSSSKSKKIFEEDDNLLQKSESDDIEQDVSESEDEEGASEGLTEKELDDENDDSQDNDGIEEVSERESDEDDGEEWGGIGGNIAIVEDSPTSKVVADAPGASTHYVPPHLRKAADNKQSEAQIKLTRQMKGLLNRMSEQNISTILDSVEEIYRNNRRHDVTSTIGTLVIDGIASHSMLLDSYVVLHAAFIASLHKIIGVEFAAYFVQSVITTYERHFSSLQTSSVDLAVDEMLGKECSNLIVLLSELYNFQVISCVLVYDLIRGLLDGDLSEFKVELLLKIVRNSGQQLRTDDPLALKDIVQIVHSKVPTDQHAMSSRTRFMVETLTNLKNNKLKKNNASDQGADVVERMKKFLSGLSKKRHLMAHEPLRVSLDDLHSAETKGKWWLVGAAWGGNPLVDRQDEIQQSNKKVSTADNILLKLAKKQGMNTDIRRSIFVVLMSGEDYVDACEHLSQLKLTEVQQREIIRVLLHCCGNEKAYNPYYAFVGQQLCRTSHSYSITLQFCLWDFLRDLGETSVGGTEVLKNLKDDVASFDVGKVSSTRSRNVARAFAWWIAKDACTLAILKPVDFTNLKPQTRQFFTEMFTHVLISTQLPTPILSSDPKDFPTTRNRGPLEEVFIKATRLETLALGLVYFLSQIFDQGREQNGGSGFVKWATKVAIETLRTGMGIVPAI